MAIVTLNVCAILLVFFVASQGFVFRHTSKLDRSNRYHVCPSDAPVFRRSSSTSRLHSSTPQKPLYDVTNYTFPDTTTPDGIATVLEASFVHGILQLREGYVDVLKLFIAAVMSSYQFGFTIGEIQDSLSNCPHETANRPLLPEEVELRHTWYSIVYVTLLAMDHSTINKEAIMDSIPSIIRETYDMVINNMVAMHKQDSGVTITVEELMKQTPRDDLGPVERALFLQTLRVATLTLVVVREAQEAGPEGESLPPTPPIEGAFE